MTNVSRKDRKNVKVKMAEKARSAQTVKELELVFTIGALYITHYYDCHPVKRFFAKLGLRSKEVSTRYMDRAKRELSDVDYDFNAWKVRYSSYGTKSLVKE